MVWYRYGYYENGYPQNDVYIGPGHRASDRRWGHTPGGAEKPVHPRGGRGLSQPDWPFERERTAEAAEGFRYGGPVDTRPPAAGSRSRIAGDPPGATLRRAALIDREAVGRSPQVILLDTSVLI